MWVIPKVEAIEVFQVTGTTTKEGLQDILGVDFTVDEITGYYDYKYRVLSYSNCRSYYLGAGDYFAPQGYQGPAVMSEYEFKRNYVEVDKL